MGYAGTQYRMPLIDTGFRDDRNAELLPPTALVYPSKNVNYHENGLSKRGGSQIMISGLGSPGQGIFQFQRPLQRTLVFAAGGNVYQTTYSNVIATGLSTQNPVQFIQTSNKLFFCDGQTAPQYWDGIAPASTAVTPPSDWTSEQPFQFVTHTRAGSGAGDRLWAITSAGVWYSKLNNPTIFNPLASGSDAGFIPIDSIGGIVGAYDLGGQLFAFSRTQTFLIQDTDATLTSWGYINAIWEGGVASWRMVSKAYNNLFLMAEDGLIYNLQGIVATGSYMSAALDRPAFVDKFIRDNVNLQSVANFHVAYDRKLRALKFFMQSTGNQNNLALVYFIDKQPESAWIIHDNESFTSAYNATCSAEVRLAPGDYQIWTMDYSGNIWALEQSSRDDNGHPYAVHIKTKAHDLNIPRNNKHFMALAFRGQASGQVDFNLYVWIEGTRQGNTTFTLNGTGATFDSAHFDVDVFANDQVVTSPVYLGYYGRDIQVEMVNNAVGEDFFLSEILFMTKPLGIKLTI